MSDPGRLDAILTTVGMPRTIRTGLLDSHQALRTAHHASQWDRVAKSGGDFTLWAYQAIAWGATRHFAESLEALPADFARRVAQLKPTKSLPAPELARLANVLSTIHSLSSLRPGTPAGAPQRMDAGYLVHASAWLLGEVVRLLGEGQPGAQAAADELAAVPRPLSWDREGQVLLRLPGLKLEERVLAALYWRHRATLAELQALLPGQSTLALAGAAARRPVELYYRKQDQSVEITAGGSAWVERELLPRLRGPRHGQRSGRGPRGPRQQGRPPPPPPRPAPAPPAAKDPGATQPEGR